MTKLTLQVVYQLLKKMDPYHPHDTVMFLKKFVEGLGSMELNDLGKLFSQGNKNQWKSVVTPLFLEVQAQKKEENITTRIYKNNFVNVYSKWFFGVRQIYDLEKIEQYKNMDLDFKIPDDPLLIKQLLSMLVFKIYGNFMLIRIFSYYWFKRKCLLYLVDQLKKFDVRCVALELRAKVNTQTILENKDMEEGYGPFSKQDIDLYHKFIMERNLSPRDQLFWKQILVLPASFSDIFGPDIEYGEEVQYKKVTGDFKNPSAPHEEIFETAEKMGK